MCKLSGSLYPFSQVKRIKNILEYSLPIYTLECLSKQFDEWFPGMFDIQSDT